MKKLSLILGLTAALAGQAYAGDWNRDAVVGGAFGGAAGAAIGSAMGGRDAAIIGGLLGGATGVAVAIRDNDYRRPEPVYYRPVVPSYRVVPVRQIYYEREEHGARHGFRHFRDYERDHGHERDFHDRDFDRRYR